jgi:enamine deaminase RidA (YjgF/YER057c/UK114 family)
VSRLVLLSKNLMDASRVLSAIPEAAVASSLYDDILAEADAKPEHIVRMTWYITDKAEYQASLHEIGAVWGEVLGKVFPTMAVIEIKGLLEERAKIEIEATAVVPD